MLQRLPSPINEKCGRVRNLVLICLALTVIVLSVYMQERNHLFLGFDDDEYVTNNHHVTSGLTGENILWAFTSFDAANWHPVTWLSHMADVQFYGLNPRGHLLTNVVIHTLSSILLLLLFYRVTGSLWKSSFVAALFALHPLHVESVAWVAERKDVLSTFFCLLTLLFYSEYVSKQKPKLYILSLFFFMLGLMSKPMLVTIPMVMLMMDFWPLERYPLEGLEHGQGQVISRLILLIKEKIPFFVCSFLSAVITIYAQDNSGAIKSFDELSFVLRMENALIAYAKYICKTFWPHDLAVFYPISLPFPFWQVIGSLSVLLLISGAVIWFRCGYPYLAVGWFWFLITLVPVIGLIQVGGQSMADRYTYIPLIGLFIMVAWGVPDLTRGLKYRDGILALLAGVVITALAALTWKQLGYWQDDISLFRHTLQVTADNSFINYNLGVSLAEKGDLDAAIHEYQEAIRINSTYKEAHTNLGIALANKGDLDAAIQEFREALRISPGETKLRNNLELALMQKGKQGEARK